MVTTFTFTGNGAITNPANWTPTGTPGPGDIAVIPTGTATGSDISFSGNTVEIGNTAGQAVLVSIGDTAVSAAHPTVDTASLIESAVPGDTTAESSTIVAEGIFVNAGTIAANGPAGSSFTIAVSNGPSQPGSFINTGTIEVDAGNSLTIAVDTGSALFNNGQIIVNGGALTLDATAGAAFGGFGPVLGDVVIGNGGTVETNVAYAPSVTGELPIYEFAADGSSGKTLKIDTPSSFGGSILGFGQGDTIDLVGVVSVDMVAFDAATGILALEDSGGTILDSFYLGSGNFQDGTFAVTGTVAGSFTLGSSKGDTILTTGVADDVFSNTDATWQTGGNWSNGVQGPRDTAVVGLNASGPFTLTTGGTPIDVGALLLSGSQSLLQFTSNGTVGPYMIHQSAGTLEVTNGVTLTATGLVLTGGTTKVDAAGLLQITGHPGLATVGAVNGTLTSAGTIALEVGVNGVIVNEGTLTVAGSAFNSGSISGALTLGGDSYLKNDGTLIADLRALYGANSANTVVNTGKIEGTGSDGVGIELSAGGTITNSGQIIGDGTISPAIKLDAGGTVINQSGGLIQAYEGIDVDGGPGSVTNAGSIVSTGCDGIEMTAGGYVTNQSSGVIHSYLAGVSISGATGTIANFGTITSTGTGFGIAAIGLGQGGLLTNAASATIGGQVYGVFAVGGVTINNAGSITGTNGPAIYLVNGGTLINSGYVHGNGIAVAFVGTGDNRVVLQPGYSFGDNFLWGSNPGSPATSTLELGTAATAGTVTAALDQVFVNFGTVTVDSGGAGWTLTGNSFLTGVTLTVLGTLTNTGLLDVTLGRLVVDPAVSPTGTLINDGIISGEVTLSGAAYLRNTATGTISNPGGDAVFGTLGAPAIVNAGMVYGGGGAGDGFNLQAGGTINNSGQVSAAGYGVVVGGTVGNIVNSGTIHAIGDAHLGVALNAGGQITNQSQGYIYGGVSVNGGLPRTIVNSGTISRPAGDGASIQSGFIDNAAGLITGSRGVFINTGTLVNAGTITGTGGTAVYFGGSSGLLVIDPGAVFNGVVNTATSAGNKIELAFGASPGTLSGLGTSFANFGTISVASGAQWTLLAGNTIGSGVTLSIAGTLTDAGVLDLNAGAIANGTVTLAAHSRINIDGVQNPGLIMAGLTIANFTPGDVIWLPGIAYNASNSAQVIAGNILSFTEGGITYDLQLDQLYASHTFGVFDNGGTTAIYEDGVACFCRGTLIGTEDGEVPVEALKIGDLVMTVAGVARRIRWLGRRGYDGRLIAGKRDVLPICISADAIMTGVPARDLRVSPEHSLYIDDVLVPAKYLLNGATVVQAESGDDVEYFHVELDSHDVIFADGAPAETFIDCDNRLMFANGGEYARLYPADDRPAWEFCAPRLEWGSPELTAIREWMLNRACMLGYAGDCEPGTHPKTREAA